MIDFFLNTNPTNFFTSFTKKTGIISARIRAISVKIKIFFKKIYYAKTLRKSILTLH